ncbi:MAG: xylulose kinase, partial [Chloroflexi bacterium]|nr:xylulose kinase [Chloroflexota bacterium]
MTSLPLILAIDHGTSSMKVALIQTDGRVLGWESQAVNLYLTPDGGAEQSPDEWWSIFLATAGRLLARFPEERARVRAVCASTQGEG